MLTGGIKGNFKRLRGSKKTAANYSELYREEKVTERKRSGGLEEHSWTGGENDFSAINAFINSAFQSLIEPHIILLNKHFCNQCAGFVDPPATAADRQQNLSPAAASLFAEQTHLPFVHKWPLRVVGGLA